MTSPDYSSHFSLANIPFGVASSKNHQNAQCVTRLENKVFFLGDLQRAGLFEKIAGLPKAIFDNSTLNDFAALPKGIQRETRRVLQEQLNSEVAASSAEDISSVTLHLPVSIGGFTDFSCSVHHVQNAGRAIMGKGAIPPSFFHFPMAYNGRPSTVVPSGTPIVRPSGHIHDRKSPSENGFPIVYGPSQNVDWELEVGVVMGQGVPRIQGLNAKDADEHIFGLVILNDWSARDIQAVEMFPLGPLNSKAFGTSISPWIVTLDALEPFRVPGAEPGAVLASHLDDIPNSSYKIDFTVEVITKDAVTTASRSKMQDLHWSPRQIASHLASCGADIRTGDILGTGTISGAEQGSHGCLLEITNGGKEAFKLADGSERYSLLDGDIVRMTGIVGGQGSGVGFGECVGELQSVADWQAN